MALPFELSQVFPFTVASIEINVKKIAGGVYVLDPPDPRHRTAVGFVGRSDKDVAESLQRQVKAGYKEFAFTYTSSVLQAYDKECEMWHEWKPIANPVHPAKPPGKPMPCAICGK